MKQLIICLLTGTIWSVVTFSQTDTAQALTSSIIFPPKKISNHFYNLQQAPSSLTVSQLLKMPEHTAFFNNSQYTYMRHSTYQPRTPLWKDIMTMAGQVALSMYASSRDRYYLSPPPR